MGKMLNRTIAGAGLVAVAAIGAFMLLGPERVWRIAGNPDQGAVDWDDLQRGTQENDAFACSREICATPPDLTLGLYEGSPQDLLARVDGIVLGPQMDGDAERVDDGVDPLARRYVVRTPLMGFPDTLNVAVRDAGGQAGLLLYSKSLIGRSDLGTNRKRLQEIVDLLRPALAP